MSDIEEWQNEKEAELARKAGITDQQQDFEFSDEDVMGIEDSEEEPEPELEDDDNNWGRSKANYYGGADDQGEDSAQEDEEEEALKLQERLAKEMSEQDFYDEDDAEGWKMQADEGIEEQLQVQVDLSTMDGPSRFNLLQESYPEVLLLAKELETCKETIKELDQEEASETLEIKKTALQSYMAMIYSYYALFTSQAQTGTIDLKEHPVMEGILKARELWNLARRVGDASMESVEDEDEELEVSGEELSDVGSGLEEGFGSENDDEISQEMSGSEVESDSADEFAISVPKAAAKKQAKRHADFDETADTVEQQARAKNKQSLRFYTSAIDKKNAVREDKFAGDLDLPYAERAFERRKRLQEEARLRGLEQKDTLGEDEPQYEDEGAEPNELYESAKNAAHDKKQHRRDLHVAAKQAAKEGRVQQYLSENPEVGAKRAIGYQIEKNRGLTPKRAKINRNARVKKRVRYEDAKKRLRGMRREYKAPTGAYTGEASGIRKNVVHSRKF